MLFIIVTFLSLLNIVSITALEITAYACLFWGISLFYSSYLKQYKMGITLSSILFLTGTILFAFTRFEILNFGNVFVPSVLVVIGISLLIANLLTGVSRVSIIFSILSLFAGIWLVISRGSSTLELYLSSLYALTKNYLWIILLLGVIIFLSFRNFKKRNIDQS